MQYKTKKPSWNDIFDNIKRFLAIIFMFLISLILVIITGVIYVSAFSTNLKSESALDKFVENISFEINWGLVAIFFLLFILTSVTLLSLFYLTWKLVTKKNYFSAIKGRIIGFSFGITLLFMIAHTLDVNGFSVLVGILSIIALTIQASNFFANIDKK